MAETQEEINPVTPTLQMEPVAGVPSTNEYSVRFADYESLFQDEAGEITELTGQTCGRLLCFQTEYAEDRSFHPCFFWLSVLEGAYYRFFLDDAYLVQWFRANVAMLEEERGEEQHIPVLDLSQLYGLASCYLLFFCCPNKSSTRLWKPGSISFKSISSSG